MAKIGRPSKYTKEVVDDLASQIEVIADEYLISDIMFHLSEIALKLGFLREYAGKFAELSDDFNYAWKKAKEVQEVNFAKALRTTGSNTAGIIFSMKNCCTWRDKKEIEINDKRVLLDVE